MRVLILTTWGCLSCETCGDVSGISERTRHINFKRFSATLRPWFVPGTSGVCPRDKTGFHCVKSGEPGFVTGTNCLSLDKLGFPRATGPKKCVFVCLFLAWGIFSLEVLKTLLTVCWTWMQGTWQRVTKSRSELCCTKGFGWHFLRHGSRELLLALMGALPGAAAMPTAIITFKI